MRAYDESYLNDAMDSLGGMLDYAANDCGYDLDRFFEWFVSCGIAEGFGSGNPRFLAGMSGVELAREVIFRTTGTREERPAAQPLEKSPEYWAGWSMAYYQWLRCVGFREMLACGLTPSAAVARYIYHEADVTKFVELADSLMAKGRPVATPLAELRRNRGFTQKQLAEAAGVSLRMVQLYEQRRNDVAKASADVVARLAHALGCRVEDLVG